MKIIDKLKNIWLGYSDKIIHFLFGYFIASLFQGSGYYMIIPAFMAGTAKEYYDAKTNKLDIEMKTIFNTDWACTFAGGFTALFVYAVSLYTFGVHLPDFITVIINK